MTRPSAVPLDVVIPLFNKMDSIERCIASVAAQSVSPATLVVIDDGSTDASHDRLQRALRDYPGAARAVRQENRGVSAARNAGVLHCAADFVCFLDADDEWRPGFLERMWRLIGDCPSADLFCLGHEVKVAGNPPLVVPQGVERGFRGVLPDFFAASVRGEVARSSKVAVRKSALAGVGGFPEGVRVGEDLHVWIMLALQGDVAIDPVAEVLVHRETDPERVRRRGQVPYPLRHFSRPGQRRAMTPSLRRYLVKIGLLHVMGSVVERDRRGGLARARALARISPLHAVAALPLLLLPTRMVSWAGAFRRSLRARVAGLRGIH